jgi:hypothetical protein
MTGTKAPKYQSQPTSQLGLQGIDDRQAGRPNHFFHIIEIGLDGVHQAKGEGNARQGLDGPALRQHGHDAGTQGENEEWDFFGQQPPMIRLRIADCGPAFAWLRRGKLRIGQSGRAVPALIQRSRWIGTATLDRG